VLRAGASALRITRLDATTRRRPLVVDAARYAAKLPAQCEAAAIVREPQVRDALRIVRHVLAHEILAPKDPILGRNLDPVAEALRAIRR
jgi:hypothetical protein